MMMDLPPSMNKAYSLIISEEGQRILGKSNSVIGGHSNLSYNLAFLSINKKRVLDKEGAISSLSMLNVVHAHVFFSRSGGRGNMANKQFSSQGSRSKKNWSNLYCDYCHFIGYAKANCYKAR